MRHKVWHRSLWSNTPDCTAHAHSFLQLPLTLDIHISCMLSILLLGFVRGNKHYIFSQTSNSISFGFKVWDLSVTSKANPAVCLFFSLAVSYSFRPCLRDIESASLSQQPRWKQVWWPRLSAGQLSFPPQEGKNRHSGSSQTAAIDLDYTPRSQNTVDVLQLFAKMAPIVLTVFSYIKPYSE